MPVIVLRIKTDSKGKDRNRDSTSDAEHNSGHNKCTVILPSF